jgi:hypothetical protein
MPAAIPIIGIGIGVAQIGMDIYGAVKKQSAINDLEKANKETYGAESNLLTAEYTHQMAQTQGEISAQAGAAGMEGGGSSGVAQTAKNAADFLTTTYQAQKDALKGALDASNAGAQAMGVSNMVSAFDMAAGTGLSLAGKAFKGGLFGGGGGTISDSVANEGLT